MILRSPTDIENHDIAVSSLIPFPLTGKGQDRGAPEQIKTSPLPSSFPVEGKESDIDASLLHHTIFEEAHEGRRNHFSRKGAKGQRGFRIETLEPLDLLEPLERLKRLERREEVQFPFEP
jgi:hypothetical protein